MDEIEFAASFRPPAATTVAEVINRRLTTPDLGELTEAAAQRAAADTAAAQREQLVMLNRAAGDPFGHVSRTQAAVSELRGEVADLEGQLSRARERLNRTAENLLYWSEQAEEVRRAATRAADPDDLAAPAKAVLAGHQQYVAASRAAIAAAATGRPRQRRPFFGGEVRRSEVTCHECQAAGATAEESWLIHADPDAQLGEDLIDLGEMTQAAWGHQGRAQAERHGYDYGMAVR